MGKPLDKNARSRHSILIILMGSLGDVARGLNLVSHIKSNLPQSRITWLVETKWAELVRFHAQIDEVIVFKRAWHYSALWELYRDLSRRQFDITLDLQRILKSGFFSLLSGARRRIGFHRRNAKEFNWIFNNEHIDYQSDKLPKIEHYLKFTEYLGLPDPDTIDFGVSSSKLRQMLPSVIAGLKNPFIAIVLGASWESKNWLFEEYLNLVQHILSDRKLQVVLVGDRSQTTASKALSQRVNESDLINLVAQTSLLELAAVLQAAVSGIGPDSGPGHLAAAVGTPYVTLFGPTSPERTAPYGCEHLVVQTELECSPCYERQCPEHNQRCMRDICADAVIKKLSLALKLGFNSQHEISKR
ncbi:MAG: glycosyltransferase family 9 protein [Desulfobacterales bacterium]|nr:glycosyltransferase family 9 protein [Desulfobacterales bacterium]